MASAATSNGPASVVPIPDGFFQSEHFNTSLYGNHIVQYPGEYSLCLGCRGCEIVCSLKADGKSGIGRSCLHVKRGTAQNNMHEVLTCMQCNDHPCYEACPLQDKAMCIDEETGVVYIVEEECIGCGLCQRACTFEPSRIVIVGKKKERKARKCDLCRDRAEGPLCIQECPALCIALTEDAVALQNSAKEA